MRDLGSDIVRADKLAMDLNRRKFLNIVILYLVIILLFITNILALYYKFHHNWLKWASWKLKNDEETLTNDPIIPVKILI